MRPPHAAARYASSAAAPRRAAPMIRSRGREEWEDKHKVATTKKHVADAGWVRRLEEARERDEVPSLALDVTMGMAGGGDGDVGAPAAQLQQYSKQNGRLPSLSELGAGEGAHFGVDEEFAEVPQADQPSQKAPPSAEDDVADIPYEDLPGTAKNKFVESEIMKMEARVLKASVRKEAKASLRAITHPAQSMFMFNNKLLPPPPNITNILTPSAIEMGEKLYVDKEFKLVYQGGPNDTYLDTGPNAASEVAFFGAEGCGKSELIEAITEQRKLSPKVSKAGSVRTIDFYQCPDPKLWRDAWADGPTKYPAATRLSRTHWGGAIVDLPGHSRSELRPDAEDSIYQCLSQYYEGTRRQLKGTFYCIDATRGMHRADEKWLKVLSEYHTRVSVVNLVLTKADLVSHAELVNLMKEIYATLGSAKAFRTKVNFPIIPTSATHGWGVRELRGFVAMQAEMVPWWKRVEEQKAAVDLMRQPVAEMKDKLLEERVKMAKGFKLLDTWNQKVEQKINEAVSGGEQAQDAEYALVKLERDQADMGMYVQAMGARRNPLIKNPYLQQTVAGGAPIGPGMAPTTVRDLVDSYKEVAAPEQTHMMQMEMDAMKTEALQVPSDSARYQRDWLTRGLGEWTDARRGVEMFTPAFRSDPDITKEDWENLPQEELESKVLRTEGTTVDKMRYGFDLNDIRNDVTSSLAAAWNAEIADGAAPARPPRAGPAEVEAEVVGSVPGAPPEAAPQAVSEDAATDILDVESEEVPPTPTSAPAAPPSLGPEYAGLPEKIRERLMALRNDPDAPAPAPAAPPAAAAVDPGDADAGAWTPSREWHPLKPWEENQDFQLRVRFAMRAAPPQPPKAAHFQQGGTVAHTLDEEYTVPMHTAEGGPAEAAPPTVVDIDAELEELARGVLPPVDLTADELEEVVAPPPPTWRSDPARPDATLERVAEHGMDYIQEAGLVGRRSGPSGWEDAANRQALRLQRDASPGVTAEELAARRAEGALPSSGLDALAGGNDAFNAAAQTGLGLGHAEASSFGDATKKSPLPGGGEGAEKADAAHAASSDHPDRRWRSFTELLNALPSDILKAAQPVPEHAVVYKPEFSAPGESGVSLRLDDGLGRNNEPTLLDADVIEKEVVEKQMGPHYMGFPWMSHEQLPSAIAIQSQEKAQEMMVTSYAHKARALALSKHNQNFGPMLVKPVSQRAKERHQREFLEAMQAKKERKGSRASTLMREIVDEQTQIVRYQEVKSGKLRGSKSYDVNIVAGRPQGLAPGKQMKYERRLVAMGEKDAFEVEHAFRKRKGDAEWMQKATPRQRMWFAMNVRHNGSLCVPRVERNGQVTYHFAPKQKKKTEEEKLIARIERETEANGPIKNARHTKQLVLGTKAKSFNNEAKSA
eukprot:TRINITY_DN12265_c0_g1_i1.p1 TRINITY_DN12265_c0_g1~~TRINITY_DN12265_c0_g1_i1.p1  ORF type:complete len:1384 (+),score=455.79 TRINITY_DN12265_c0_g1_i1:111-4262(+)